MTSERSDPCSRIKGRRQRPRKPRPPPCASRDAPSGLEVAAAGGLGIGAFSVEVLVEAFLFHLFGDA